MTDLEKRLAELESEIRSLDSPYLNNDSPVWEYLRELNEERTEILNMLKGKNQ